MNTACNSFGIIMAGGVVVTMNQNKTWPSCTMSWAWWSPASILTDGIDYGCTG